MRVNVNMCTLKSWFCLLIIVVGYFAQVYLYISAQYTIPLHISAHQDSSV